MHTPKRRSASPHIGRLRPLNPSARTPLQSLLPCARRGHFAKRPMAVTCLGERVERTASVAGWPNEPDGQISRRSPGERDGWSQFVQANRRRHIGTIWAKRTQDTKQDDVTSPIARIRQRKPPHEPAVLWPNEPERPPRCRVGRNVRLRRTNPEPRHARRLYLLPLGSIRVLAFWLKILLYFSCCLQGGLFLRSLWLCPFSAFEKTNRRKSRRSERTRGAELTRQPGCFGRTNPRTQPNSLHFGQTNPRRQPGHACGQTNPRGTQSGFQPNEPKRPTVRAPSPNEPGSNRAAHLSAKRTQGAAQSRFGLHERTPMSLVTPSS